MAFSRQSLLVVLAASAALMGGVEAFAPPARAITIARTSSPLFSTMVDDVTAEDEPQDFLLEASDLDGVESAETEDPTPASWISQQRIAELRITHRRHETDCGSPEFQVAGMTERISYLTKHLQQHPKDFSTRRGLVAMVNKRRRLLNYLYQEDQERYVAVVQSLGVRHKPPGRYDREEKYASYPKQKAIKKHLLKRK